MASTSPVQRTVMFAGAVCMLIASVLSLGVGVLAVSVTRTTPGLSVTEGNEVKVPKKGLMGGSITVYVSSPEPPQSRAVGCALSGGDSNLRTNPVSDLKARMSGPRSVDGTTWYPFVEIDLGRGPTAFACEGVSGPFAVTESSALNDAGLITAGAFGAAGLMAIAGTVGVVLLRPRRGTSR